MCYRETPSTGDTRVALKTIPRGRNTRFQLILRFSKRSISHIMFSGAKNFAHRTGSPRNPEKTFGTRHQSEGTSEGQFGLATQNDIARPFAFCCISNHRRPCFSFRHYPRIGLFSSVVVDGICGRRLSHACFAPSGPPAADHGAVPFLSARRSAKAGRLFSP